MGRGGGGGGGMSFRKGRLWSSLGGSRPGEGMCRGKEEMIRLGALILLIPQTILKDKLNFDSLKRGKQRLQEFR